MEELFGALRLVGSVFLDSLNRAWHFKPGSGFVEAAFAINCVLAIYERVSEIAKDSLVRRFRERVGKIKVEKDITSAAAQQAIEAFFKGIDALGRKVVVSCRKISILAAVICLLLLYLDVTGWWVVFLALTPAYCFLAYRHYAIRRFKRFEPMLQGFCELSDRYSQPFPKQEISQALDKQDREKGPTRATSP